MRLIAFQRYAYIREKKNIKIIISRRVRAFGADSTDFFVCQGIKACARLWAAETAKNFESLSSGDVLSLLVLELCYSNCFWIQKHLNVTSYSSDTERQYQNFRFF